VRYYNDSIATAPERVIAAIRSFQEPLIVILTGRDKHLPWESAARLLCRRARAVVVSGELAGKAASALRDASQVAGRAPDLLFAASFDDAVQTAVAIAQPGEVVLLSPGGTSYDRFRDFEERGEYFTHLVHEAIARGSVAVGSV
ncbi:MAG: UDP-N-acetylmuramoyl-L-alanine--D-glutamate ligase, partial [Chloroflexi bacterium]|nr:UDP-N-acetylmuramoyl-L-alanine--D-glutamate ligase [Chloroflexota bacterium]